MKIVVLSSVLSDEHKSKISGIAGKYSAEVCFTESEESLPEGFEEPDIIYGFGMKTAKRCTNLKWLCVPSAGVDYLIGDGAYVTKVAPRFVVVGESVEQIEHGVAAVGLFVVALGQIDAVVFLFFQNLAGHALFNHFASVALCHAA